MVIGCIMFTLPHFLATDHNAGIRRHHDFFTSDKNHTLSTNFTEELKGGRNSVCKRENPQSSKFTGHSNADNDSSHLGNSFTCNLCIV